MTPRQRLIGALAMVSILAMFALPATTSTAENSEPGLFSDSVQFWLTLLHNNDGESQLINAGLGLEEFGGVARFATLVQQLKHTATQDARHRPLQPFGPKHGVIMVSSGDNFLAGPEFNASLEKGVPFFDAIALDLVGYHAMVIGNHEFDFGPDVLADFMLSFTSSPVPFLSANLDFRQEPRLHALVDRGRIAPSVVVETAGERIGIVGATTPRLPFISSPRHVNVNPDVTAAVQAEVDRLQAQGVNKIVLISHLQSIEEDLALAPQLRGIDIMVAGGGDELLANPGHLLIPGDDAVVFAPYPLTATDADGHTVYVVTTSGGYRYVGQFVVGFDGLGRIVAVDHAKSGPVRVAGGDHVDAVAPDAVIEALVTGPIKATVVGLAATVIATTEVLLDGVRSAVRTKETNAGNVVADALLFQAMELAESFGAHTPDVALQNAGGIRNDTLIPVGNITKLTTFDILPFANFVTIVPDISPGQFKEILENAASRVELTDGRFVQIAGFRFVWNPAGTPQTLDASGNVVTPGTRIRSVVLNDGTEIVRDGAVVQDAPGLHIATIDFLARGGDEYPYRGAPFVTLGVTYQQALQAYLVRGLGGVITAAQYPEGGEGRIKTIKQAASATTGLATFNASTSVTPTLSSHTCIMP